MNTLYSSIGISRQGGNKYLDVRSYEHQLLFFIHEVRQELSTKYYNFNFRILEENPNITATTTKVIHPPNITEGTVPINLAASPLSKAPISLLEEIKI